MERGGNQQHLRRLLDEPGRQVGIDKSLLVQKLIERPVALRRQSSGRGHSDLQWGLSARRPWPRHVRQATIARARLDNSCTVTLPIRLQLFRSEPVVVR